MSIGSYLKQLRFQKGYSIRQVAMKSNGLLDKTTVSRIERNERSVSVRALSAFSQIYEVPSDELLTHLVKENIHVENVQFDVNPEERRIVEQYRSLQRRGQNAMRELMAQLVRAETDDDDVDKGSSYPGPGRSKPGGRRVMEGDEKKEWE